MRRPMCFLFSGLLVLVINGLPISVRQAPTQRHASEQRSTQQNAKIPSAENRIRTQVNEITTPVTVIDKNGNFVFGIPEKDFHVFDNGIEQRINRWGLDDHPLALALVIETSSHIDMMAREIRSNGIVVTETLMAEDGEAAVIGAGDTAEVRQPFTSNHDSVEKAVQSIRFADDSMHLYDAMFEGALLLAKQPDTYHRVLLVIAEAQDSGSRHKLENVLQVAQRANVSIYTIGLSSTAADLRDDPVKDAEGEKGEDENIPDAAVYPTAPAGVSAGVGGGACLLCLAIWLTQRITHIRKSHAMGAAVAFTGGAYYHPFKDRNIQVALSHIAEELHSQYVLSYQLEGGPQPGVHQIEVRVDRPRLTVRARLGYYLAPPIP